MEAIPKNHNLSKTSPKSLLIRFCNFSNKKILLFNIDLFHENFETTRRIQSECGTQTTTILTCIKYIGQAILKFSR